MNGKKSATFYIAAAKLPPPPSPQILDPKAVTA